jgi:hypothetical protein
MPFRSSRAKVERARALIGQLERDLDSYDGARIIAEDRPEGMAWVVRVRNDPTDQVGAATGDIIHNLRSSLDHAAISVVVLNNKSPKGVHFPFSEDAGALEEQIKKKYFHRASAEAIDLLKSLRPYKGGDAALRGLHDLDILDKHVDLITLLGVAILKEPVRVGNLVIRDSGFGLSDGAVAIMVTGVKGAAMYAPLNVKLSARFGSGTSFSLKELIPTVSALLEHTARTVEAFAALYGV